MEVIAVKEVAGAVHCLAGEGDVRLGGVAPDADGGHLHGDAVVRAGPLDRLKELGSGGRDGVKRPSTVRAQLTRARQMLARLLKEEL